MMLTIARFTGPDGKKNTNAVQISKYIELKHHLTEDCVGPE
jgi:hypothetical protein